MVSQMVQKSKVRVRRVKETAKGQRLYEQLWGHTFHFMSHFIGRIKWSFIAGHDFSICAPVMDKPLEH